MKTFLFIAFQYLCPQHTLSRLAGSLANCRIQWIKTLFIEKFIRRFDVDMSQALHENPDHFACFNDFFVRELKPDVRPIHEDIKTLTSPADGSVSQAGKIENGDIFQAKGRHYTTIELLGGDAEIANEFKDGQFATIYLSPKDYHRLHMPIDGTLLSMTHVPGQLFSVNPATTENVPRLFARNERVICIFETPIGKVALVLVGAMIVASIETTWAGLVAPAGKQISTHQYQGPNISFKKGEEFARFKLGSTIIVLSPRDTIQWEETFCATAPVQMGQAMAKLTK